MEEESIQRQMENGQLGDTKVRREVIPPDFTFGPAQTKRGENEPNIASIMIRSNCRHRQSEKHISYNMDS